MAKHPGGRPPKYNNCLDLDAACELYFDSCWEYDDAGNQVKQVIPYTICGLALSIGMDRVSLLRYAKDGEFCNTVKKAKAKCERYAEQHLFTGKNVAGAIFNLKNNYNGWKDNVGLEHTGKDGGPIEQSMTSFPPDPKSLDEWLEMKKKIDNAGKTEKTAENEV